MNNAPVLRFSKDQLLVALRALLPIAKKQDTEAIKQHAIDEKAHLKAFKEACRDALKWDYQTASNRGFTAHVRDGSTLFRKSRPSCPMKREDHLNRLIAMVERSERKRYSISQGGQNQGLFYELTRDMPKEKDVC
jgi:hypothetical protein